MGVSAVRRLPKAMFHAIFPIPLAKSIAPSCDFTMFAYQKKLKYFVDNVTLEEINIAQIKLMVHQFTALSHENPCWSFIDQGCCHASSLRKASRFRKIRIRSLHRSLHFVVPSPLSRPRYPQVFSFLRYPKLCSIRSFALATSASNPV